MQVPPDVDEMQPVGLSPVSEGAATGNSAAYDAWIADRVRRIKNKQPLLDGFGADGGPMPKSFGAPPLVANDSDWHDKLLDDPISTELPDDPTSKKWKKNNK